MGEKLFLQLRGLLLIHRRNAGEGIGQLHGLVFVYAQQMIGQKLYPLHMLQRIDKAL